MSDNSTREGKKKKPSEADVALKVYGTMWVCETTEID